MPIAFDEYVGFIFLNLDPEPRQSLEEFFGPIGPRLKGLPFDQFTFGETVFHEVQCNWKFGIEAHSEGYHVPVRHIARSEEHTSELQSLMRISYAVFCLKKKNKTNTTHTTHCLITTK